MYYHSVSIAAVQQVALSAIWVTMPTKVVLIAMLE
jgi:hypothetical protein